MRFVKVAFMDYIRLINEIKERAARAGTSLRGLCVEAGVPYSTICRWLADENSSPRLKAFEEIIGKLNAAIARRETAQLHDLVVRYPDVARETLAATERAA